MGKCSVMKIKNKKKENFLPLFSFFMNILKGKKESILYLSFFLTLVIIYILLHILQDIKVQKLYKYKIRN